MRAAQHAHKKQRTASPDHRTDSATRDTKGSNRKHKHDAEQHSEEKTEKGKHRKSRRDDFRSDKECDTRPSTSKDFNQRPYSPAKKVNEDDLLLKKDGKRTDPFMHTKQDGFEGRKNERTPTHLSPKHEVKMSNSPKTGSERISKSE